MAGSSVSDASPADSQIWPSWRVACSFMFRAASFAQDLTNCAGAIAAHAGIDVLAYPRGASGEWADVLGGIIEAMNREEGVQGMTGRYAASAARAYWAEQPRDAREAAANTCRARFGRG